MSGEETLYRRLKLLPHRTFHIPISPSSTTLPIHISEPGLVADQLPLETWASSTILASRLHRIPISFPAACKLPIVELGAGTGLVGIAAARVYGQRVVLTDLPPILPALEANASLNEADAVAGVLDWCSPDDLQVGGEEFPAAEGGAQVLIAADTLYDPEHPELLERVVGKWLARNAEARFLLATAMRVAYLEELRELWERLEGLGLVCAESGQEEASEKDFDDERLVEWSVWRWEKESLQAH